MFKLVLITVVVAPVLLGMLTAARVRGRTGLLLLLALVFAYAAFYILLLHYLRLRWVG